MTLKLKIKRLSNEVKLPNYHYEGDAALNLYSVEDVLLKPNEQVSVKTGIAIIIPEGYTGLIWDRSGISIKHGIKTLGGVIDAGYRGEVAVGFINISKNDYQIQKGDKIAQMIIQKFENVSIEEVEELDDKDTHRGEKGFGSSGK
jgi:dUTP pyrophosphatase